MPGTHSVSADSHMLCSESFARLEHGICHPRTNSMNVVGRRLLLTTALELSPTPAHLQYFTKVRGNKGSDVRFSSG